MWNQATTLEVCGSLSLVLKVPRSMSRVKEKHASELALRVLLSMLHIRVV